jgi:hypothetical protein
VNLKILSRKVYFNGDIQEVSEKHMKRAERAAKKTGETPEQYLERIVIENEEGQNEEIKEANIRGVEIQLKNTLDWYIQPKSMDAIRKVKVNYI